MLHDPDAAFLARGEGNSPDRHRTGTVPRLNLELLASNFYRRRRRDDSLLMRRVGYRFNHPLPVPTPILVKGPSPATAIPDLRLPVVIVGRNC